MGAAFFCHERDHLCLVTAYIFIGWGLLPIFISQGGQFDQTHEHPAAFEVWPARDSHGRDGLWKNRAGHLGEFKGCRDGSKMFSHRMGCLPT